MRAYYIPAAAGVMLIVSAFLPWMRIGDVPLGGVPETAGVWILGLGAVAVLLAGLSIWTRKNSRHPLLLVGLAAFAITFLGYQWMSRTVRDAAWAQARASIRFGLGRFTTEQEIDEAATIVIAAAKQMRR